VDIVSEAKETRSIARLSYQAGTEKKELGTVSFPLKEATEPMFITHQDRQNREKIRCSNILNPKVFLRPFCVECAVRGFGRQRPWGLIPTHYIDTA